MLRDTEVTKFIRQKYDEMSNEHFEKPDKGIPMYFQKHRMDTQIDEVKEYITAIESNKGNYEYSGDTKELKPRFKNVIEGLKKDLEKYKLYRDYIYILNNYNNREEIIDNKIGVYGNQCDLGDEQLKLLTTVDKTNLNDISCYDLTMIAKYLISNYDISNKLLLNNIFEFISDKYNGKKLKEEDYIYISGLNHTIQYKLQMSNDHAESKQDLNCWKKSIDKIIASYEKNKSVSYDSRYDFIESIIDDEIAFNKALNDFPDIVHLRDKIGNPLSYNIMIKYLDTYFLELCGIESKISKEYYLEIYNKIISSSDYKINAIDAEAFELLRDCFIKVSSIVLNNNKNVIKSLDQIDGLTNKI